MIDDKLIDTLNDAGIDRKCTWILEHIAKTDNANIDRILECAIMDFFDFWIYMKDEESNSVEKPISGRIH